MGWGTPFTQGGGTSAEPGRPLQGLCHSQASGPVETTPQNPPSLFLKNRFRGHPGVGVPRLDTTGQRGVARGQAGGRGPKAGGDQGARASPVVPGSDLMKLSVLLPLVSAVLLLLLVAASVFAWRTAKRQKNAAGISPEQVLQPLESELCYANLTLTQTGASPRSSRRKSSTKLCPSAQEGKTGVEYVTMTSFPKEDISYAALTLDTPNQELIYSNMDGLTNHLYHQSHEEATEYSTIMKP